MTTVGGVPDSAGSGTAGVTVVVALAPAAGRLSVDALTGAVTRDDRGATMSAPDAAALEVALGFGETWGVPVIALSAGGVLAETVARDALAVGVDRAVHVEADDTAEPVDVAAALADVVRQVAAGTNVLVLTGVHGVDVASAAVPACLAYHLAAEQALGAIAVEPGATGRCQVTRRLDRGARERLAVEVPAVVSVEGSVATLRRAGLGALLATERAEIEHVVPAVTVSARAAVGRPGPWRPRARVVTGPVGSSALERIKDLTGVAAPAKASRTVEADPAEAAEAILDELGSWGHGPRSSAE